MTIELIIWLDLQIIQWADFFKCDLFDAKFADKV